MIFTEKQFAKETKRLFALPFPPSTDDGKDSMLHEWYLVLKEHVETPEHLTAIVDWLMRHSPRCPLPSDVEAAAVQIGVPAKKKAPLGCEKCQGSGYVHFTKMVRIVGMDPYEADFSKPCDCALGQFIQPEYDKRKNVTPGRSQDLG